MFVYDQNGNKMPVKTAENFTQDRMMAKNNNNDNDRDKKRRRMWIAIGIAIVAVLVVGLLVWYFSKKSPDSVASPPEMPASMGYGRKQRFGFRFY